jgi:hypothetical protein
MSRRAKGKTIRACVLDVEWTQDVAAVAKSEEGLFNLAMHYLRYRHGRLFCWPCVKS